MTITTDPIDRNLWRVRAAWFGAERTVFTGSLFACLAYRQSNR